MGLFTQLAREDVATIAARFGIGEVRSWTAIPAGTINSNFVLETARGKWFLRINEGKSEEDVRYEVELVTALVAGGTAAPLPCRTTSGEPFMVHAGGHVSLFPWVAGAHRQSGEVAPGDARELGQALARLHLAGQKIAARFTRTSRYAFAAIVERFRHVQALPVATSDPVLVACLPVIGEEIAWLQAQEPVRSAATTGIIHGDLFPDNVFFSGDALTALIDFEQASTGSLPYDLAVCLNSWCFGRDDFDRRLLAAMLAGYDRVRPLPPEDRQALAVEVRGAAMRFAVTRITDVYLPKITNPTKDFRRFLARLARWRELGTQGLADCLHDQALSRE